MRPMFPWPHIVGAWLCSGWVLHVLASYSQLARVICFALGLALYLALGHREWRKTFGDDR